MSIWDSIKKLFGDENEDESSKKTKRDEAAEKDSEQQEITSGGSVVYRYEEPEKDGDHLFPEQTCVYLEEIEAHLTKYIGTPDMVFHEIISEIVHIDVHWIKPSADYPYNILVTSGMSDLLMSVPEELENKKEYERAELMVVLPADWKIGQEEFEDKNNYWPIYFLKMLARFPHQYHTWLGYGHTIPNGPEGEPIADTGFTGILLLPPMLMFDHDFLTMQTSDGELINFYALIPLYQEEMDFKLERGTDDLMDRMDEVGVTELIDIYRPNTCG